LPDFLELFFSFSLLLLLLAFLEAFLEEEDSSEEEEEEEEVEDSGEEEVLALELMRDDTVGYCTKALKGLLESALDCRRRSRAEWSTPKTRAERSTKPGLLAAVTPVTPWPMPCCMRLRLRRMGEDPDKDPSAPAAASSRAMVLPRLLC
jgi:hypothetical protein